MSLHPVVAAGAAAALLLVGAVGAYLLLIGRHEVPVAPPVTVGPSASTAPTSVPAPAPSASTSEPRGASPASTPAEEQRLPDVVVPLSPEAAARAGITTTRASVRRASSAIRIPGVVEANAYRQVAVTPLVAGRVTSVAVDLGDRVRRGQTMADVYSPELAEAQTRYVSAKAELEAHDRALQRTERLVAIGAASRQELERIHAEHTAQTATVQTARTKLALLGMSEPALDALAPGRPVDATTTVPAPIDGIVTERVANPGLNVDPSMKLFTVVDLSTVWVMADLYERDFAHVRIGSAATVTTNAYPGRSLHGRVGYIDPQVNRETRTARLRIEVPNPRGELRLGMYADVVVGTSEPRDVVVVPRGAVQHIGGRTVVYLANASAPGRFVERDVSIGRVGADEIEIEAGVQRTDVVVSGGSFFLRAERERLGLGPAAPSASPGSSSARPATDAGGPGAAAGPSVQEATVRIVPDGFSPARLTLRAGLPARLTFIRTTDQTCATAVVFPSLAIRRELPLNQPVAIEITPSAGELSFACGMDMLKGTIVVR
ncbi:MAG: efflux RND transporter periplasmic adaptor subunit [Acidobacteria bacterium]|nr:efflux RND transporter periplasmic adaptor subunit [Acidobacteriota bacterium]